MSENNNVTAGVTAGVGAEVPLGKEVSYSDQYNPALLFAIDRQLSRNSLGIVATELPFTGVDIWNAYELSWLNTKGKPLVACAEFRVPCTSVAIIESKSFKLYLNSFNQSMFGSVDELQLTLTKDLSALAGAAVEVTIVPLASAEIVRLATLQGRCLDQMDVTITEYQPDPLLLTADAGQKVEEVLHSHLLRSLCPVTGQPDWGSVQIQYCGPRIEPEGLLKYLIGYRQHQEFHEQCVERIFCDLMQSCQPTQLTVYARYVRRGGLDINPFRSTEQRVPINSRLIRQ